MSGPESTSTMDAPESQTESSDASNLDAADALEQAPGQGEIHAASPAENLSGNQPNETPANANLSDQDGYERYEPPPVDGASAGAGQVDPGCMDSVDSIMKDVNALNNHVSNAAGVVAGSAVREAASEMFPEAVADLAGGLAGGFAQAKVQNELNETSENLRDELEAKCQGANNLENTPR